MILQGSECTLILLQVMNEDCMCLLGRAVSCKLCQDGSKILKDENVIIKLKKTPQHLFLSSARK